MKSYLFLVVEKKPEMQKDVKPFLNLHVKEQEEEWIRNQRTGGGAET